MRPDSMTVVSTAVTAAGTSLKLRSSRVAVTTTGSSTAAAAVRLKSARVGFPASTTTRLATGR